MESKPRRDWNKLLNQLFKSSSTPKRWNVFKDLKNELSLPSVSDLMSSSDERSIEDDSVDRFLTPTRLSECKEIVQRTPLGVNKSLINRTPVPGSSKKLLGDLSKLTSTKKSRPSDDRTPLDETLTNLTPQNKSSKKRKSDSTAFNSQLTSIKKLRPSPQLPPPSPQTLLFSINPDNKVGQYSNQFFDSPYNSPATPNVIKNLDKQCSMYAMSRTFMNITNFPNISVYNRNTTIINQTVKKSASKKKSHKSPITADAECPRRQSLTFHNSAEDLLKNNVDFSLSKSRVTEAVLAESEDEEAGPIVTEVEEEIEEEDLQISISPIKSVASNELDNSDHSDVDDEVVMSVHDALTDAESDDGMDVQDDVSSAESDVESNADGDDSPHSGSENEDDQVSTDRCDSEEEAEQAEEPQDEQVEKSVNDQSSNKSHSMNRSTRSNKSSVSTNHSTASKNQSADFISTSMNCSSKSNSKQTVESECATSTAKLTTQIETVEGDSKASLLSQSISPIKAAESVQSESEDEENQSHASTKSNKSTGSVEQSIHSQADCVESNSEESGIDVTEADIGQSDTSASKSECEESSKEIVITRKPKKADRSLKRKILNELNFEPAIITPSDGEGVSGRPLRRSARNRVLPLDYWRGQRPVYKVEVKTNEAGKKVPICTLVGINKGQSYPEVKRKVNRKSKKAAAVPVETKQAKQNAESVLNLSVHNKKFAKYAKDDGEIEQEGVVPFSHYQWKESKMSNGVSTTIINKMGKHAFGMLRLDNGAKKGETKTGDYVTHFTVLYGVVLIKVASKPQVLIKPGSSFVVDKSTTYSVKNCRDDQALVSFAVMKD